MKFDFFDFLDFEKVFLMVVVGVLIYYIGSYCINNDLRDYNDKVDLYEKILMREYNRTFESYEDYLVYRIEIGK